MWQDELLWAAAWLHKATNMQSYWNYVMSNMHLLGWTQAYTDPNYVGPNGEFGWDNKHAGLDVLISNVSLLTQLISSLLSHRILLPHFHHIINHMRYYY